MKKTFLSLAAAASVAVFAAQSMASGHSHANDVVRDFQNNIVKNTWDNCVITKWQGGVDTCTDINSELLSVYFNFDSAELTLAAQEKLDKVADILSNSSNVQSIDIVGYADYLGNRSYNRRLSDRRAKAVRSYLESRGYLNTRDVSVMALGENQPVAECDGVTGQELKACLWRDRRVEIKLNYIK